MFSKKFGSHNNFNFSSHDILIRPRKNGLVVLLVSERDRVGRTDFFF